jgi:hypothetical protein
MQPHGFFAVIGDDLDPFLVLIQMSAFFRDDDFHRASVHTHLLEDSVLHNPKTDAIPQRFWPHAPYGFRQHPASVRNNTARPQNKIRK